MAQKKVKMPKALVAEQEAGATVRVEVATGEVTAFLDRPDGSGDYAVVNLDSGATGEDITKARQRAVDLLAEKLEPGEEG